VVSLVVWDVTEVIPQVLGDSSKIKVSLPEVFSEIPNGAELIHSPHAITTLKLDNMNHVVPHNLPPNVLKLVTKNQEKIMILIKSLPLTHIPSPTMKLKSKPKSKHMDQSKLHSLFMKISFHIKPEFINTLLDLNSEDMPSKSLDGELKMVPNIGLLLTHGTKIGVTKVPSRS